MATVKSKANRARNAEWKQLTIAQREHKLRQRATASELRLLHLLNLHPETRGRFVFQQHLMGYYPDFLFKSARLIVELDGAVHSSLRAKFADRRRTSKLSASGYRVIRFWNAELRDEMRVVGAIVNALEEPRVRIQF